MITISLMQISVPLSDSLIPFLRGLREPCDCHLLEVELYSLQKVAPKHSDTILYAGALHPGSGCLAECSFKSKVASL